jgi:hypothetical protein
LPSFSDRGSKPFVSTRAVNASSKRSDESTAGSASTHLDRQAEGSIEQLRGAEGLVMLVREP